MSDDGTNKLQENLLAQQERLLQQLADLEEIKDEVEDTEYDEMKNETLEQIADIAASLTKLTTGNITLTDELGSQKKLTMTAISKAFRTPEVIRMFARREPDQLRQRLTEKQRDFKLGKLSAPVFNQDKKELLEALKHLGEKLTEEESRFLATDEVDRAANFVPVVDKTDVSGVIDWAKKEQSKNS